jgi:hypothetical protein
MKILYAFDLIELNGDDLRRDPLEVRKATLASIVAKASSGTGEALAISIPSTEASVVRLFPGANALQIVRAGCSVRNLWRAHEFPRRSPSLRTVFWRKGPTEKGSRDPASAAVSYVRAGFPNMNG